MRSTSRHSSRLAKRIGDEVDAERAEAELRRWQRGERLAF
jgi:hypothetical protein